MNAFFSFFERSVVGDDVKRALLKSSCVKLKSGRAKSARFCTTSQASFPDWEPLSSVLPVQSAHLLAENNQTMNFTAL